MPVLKHLLAFALLASSALCEQTSQKAGILGIVPNTTPVTADATATFSAVTQVPSVIYGKGFAGESKNNHTSNGGNTSTDDELFYDPIWKLVEADRPSYVVPLDPDQIFAQCIYPLSGYYDSLTRYLFYVTLFFALIARKHQWLFIGSLATSLTYSASVAIHACIMVWAGHSAANSDIYAALGVLTLSASLLVPLLNWSTTIKNTGKDREEETVGRTVIISWGFLVFIGLLSLFILIWKDPLQFYFDTTALSSTQNITCSPQSGVLDLTAGQEQGWSVLVVTTDFIQSNSCSNPCTGILDFDGDEVTTPLRKTDDLVPLSAKQVNHFFALNLSKKEQAFVGLYWGFIVVSSIALTWVILQGLTILRFGRRSPRQIRNKVYVGLTRLFSRKEVSSDFSKPDFKIDNHRWPSFIARFVAFAFYVWAWSATVIGVLLAIGTIFATEYWLFELPSGDKLYQVDQWGSWAAAALVVIVAFIYHFQGIFEDVFLRTVNAFLRLFFRCIHRREHISVAKTHNTGPANRVIIRNAVHHKLDGGKTMWSRFTESVKNEFKSTHNFLWNNNWNDAVENCGKGHLRRRRAVTGTHDTLPEGWNKVHEDKWMDIEEFISEARAFDKEYKQKYGHGYKWQPRVTGELPLRTQFDHEVWHDIFRRDAKPEVSSMVYTIVPETRYDEEMAYKKSNAFSTETPLYHQYLHQKTASLDSSESNEPQEAEPVMVEPPRNRQHLAQHQRLDSDGTNPLAPVSRYSSRRGRYASIVVSPVSNDSPTEPSTHTSPEIPVPPNALRSNPWSATLGLAFASQMPQHRTTDGTSGNGASPNNNANPNTHYRHHRQNSSPPQDPLVTAYRQYDGNRAQNQSQSQGQSQRQRHRHIGEQVQRPRHASHGALGILAESVSESASTGAGAGTVAGKALPRTPPTIRTSPAAYLVLEPSERDTLIMAEPEAEPEHEPEPEPEPEYEDEGNESAGSNRYVPTPMSVSNPASRPSRSRRESRYRVRDDDGRFA